MGGLSSFAGELNLAVCPLSGYSPFMTCQNSRGVALLHVGIDSHVLSLHQAQRHLGSPRGRWSGYMPCNNHECHQLILLLQAETGKPTCLQGQNSTANSNQASPLERGRESAQASFGSLGNGYRILPPHTLFPRQSVAPGDSSFPHPGTLLGRQDNKDPQACCVSQQRKCDSAQPSPVAH